MEVLFCEIYHSMIFAPAVVSVILVKKCKNYLYSGNLSRVITFTNIAILG